MEYSRVAPEHVYVRDNTKESVAEKGRDVEEEEEVKEEEMQDEGGGVPKGGKWLVGEDDGTGRGGGRLRGRRDHAALSSINLSAAVV